MSNNFDILEVLWLRRERKRRAQKIIEGVPPLTYTAKNASTLKNYRIYGNTVNGESVGDRTGNLFDGKFLQGYWAFANGVFSTTKTWICTDKIPCTGGRAYTYSFLKASRWSGFVWYDADENYISTSNNQNNSGAQYRLWNAEAPSNAAFMIINIAGYPSSSDVISPSDITDFMLVEGEYTSNTMPVYEPYGYRVPVKAEGKNILPMSTTPISTDVDDFHCEYDGAGTITLTTDKDNAQLSSFSIPLSKNFVIPVSIGQGGDGCLQLNNSVAASSNTNESYIKIFFYNDTTAIDDWGLTTINRLSSNYSSMGGKTINRIAIAIGGTGFGTNREIVIKPAFILNTTEQVSFEPYQTPITTNIYLPEQLKKVGDDAEYISYSEQKLHRIGADDIDVTLPELLTLAGTNVLTVGTAVQPSKVIVKGKISQE